MLWDGVAFLVHQPPCQVSIPAASIAIRGVSIRLDSPQGSGPRVILVDCGCIRRHISVDQGLQAPLNGAPRLAGGSEPTLTRTAPTDVS